MLIPDCRFPNEIDKLKAAGFNSTHVRVNRPGFVSPLTDEQQKHISETALDNVEPDYWIQNSRDLEYLNELATILADALVAKKGE